MAVIDKTELAKVIAKNLVANEQPELFLEWVEREGTTMADVLKWASESEIKEAIRLKQGDVNF